MNISFNWLKEFISYPFEIEELSALLTDIGLEVGKIHSYMSVEGGLEGVIVGEIVSCSKHPNADRLSLTQVSIGEDELLAIVCGAPNVEIGQKVFVAKVGTMLYPTGSDPFVIKKAKIRRESSAGMICAEDELGLGDNHDGIMVLPRETVVGAKASDIFEIEHDTIFEIDLTPNRSDATSHYGVAKDLLAALRVRNNFEGQITMPTIQNYENSDLNSPFNVSVENSIACPRYTGVLLTDITIKPSPKWMQNRLNAIGVRPISNVVDITNYVLHELGQPLHAFDSDKIDSQEIVVKCLPEGSKFATLDEKVRSLNEEDLMICDGSGQGLCIGGVFGGMHSGVTEETSHIFLEAAHFNPEYIRRSATRHLLRTDAAKIFEKGSDPNRCVMALQRAVDLMIEHADAKVSSNIFDIYPSFKSPVHIKLPLTKLNLLSGHSFIMDDVESICLALEMNIILRSDTDIEVQIPTDRTDVLRQEDLIEEILRIYGFNNISKKNKIEFSVGTRIKSDLFSFKQKIAQLLCGFGFNEMLGLSMTESKYYEGALKSEKSQRVLINNTSNIHLDTMRTNLLLSSLEAIRFNHNRNQKEINFFEIGSSYAISDNGFIEKEIVSFSVTGLGLKKNWLTGDSTSYGFYFLKSKTEALLLALGINSWEYNSTSLDYYSYGLDIIANNKIIGHLGNVSDVYKKEFDVSADCFYAQLEIRSLLQDSNKVETKLKPISKYPSVYRDISVRINDTVNYDDIKSIIKKRGKSLVQNVALFDVYQDDQMKTDKTKSYSINIEFTDSEKTLSDKEVDKIMMAITGDLDHQLDAQLR